MKAILDSIQTYEEEIRFFDTLTEDEACELYNVDYKAEAITYIKDWWRVN